MEAAIKYQARQDYILKRIEIMKQTLRSFQRLSKVLFGVALVSFGLSFLVSFDKSLSLEFLKYGLSSLAAFSGIALQGVKYLYQIKLVDLEYSIGLVDHYESLKDFEKRIVNHALDGIFDKKQV
jgi:hypothetical protein